MLRDLESVVLYALSRPDDMMLLLQKRGVDAES